MYTEPSHFETELIKISPLFHLSKQDLDLFLIAQTNLITYKQLAATGFHGTTGVGDRLSLKRLEKEFLIQCKQLPNRQNYYTLTAKGKQRILRLFGQKMLEEFQIDWERKPPAKLQQLLHRIHTNDLYYAYLSFPFADVPIWKLEQSYLPNLEELSTPNPPRCDAKMEVFDTQYYMEQDNGTQTETMLETKLKQYLNSHLFQPKTYKNHVLVFTLHGQERTHSSHSIPSYSIYRLLLKLCKLWKQIGEEEAFSSIQFTIQTNPAYAVLFTKREQRMLELLKAKHTSKETLMEFEQLKKSYYYHAANKEEEQKIQDLSFAKRRKKILQMIETISELQIHLWNGMQFFLLPNHRLKEQIPFLMASSSGLKDSFLQALFYAGLDTNDWNYYEQKTMEVKPHMTFLFYHVCSDHSHKNNLIFLDVINNVGDVTKLFYLLLCTSFPALLVCMVNESSESINLQKQIQQTPYSSPILYLNKQDVFRSNTKNTIFYVIKETADHVLFPIPVYLEYHIFSEKILMMEGDQNETMDETFY